MHLPQLNQPFATVKAATLSNAAISRMDMVERLAHRLIDTRNAIAAREMEPSRIVSNIRTFTPSTQLARVFRYHQEIQNMRGHGQPANPLRFSMNILMLTSEFAPAMGGIGTYAREIAVAASHLGARITVLAPDYAKDLAAEDQTLPFRLVRFRGGLHSMRDLPAKILLTQSKVRIEDFDIIHAADWPFFIPLALARHRTDARLLMTVHGTEINETQTPLKRAAIRATGVFGPRTEVAANSRFTRELFRERFAIDEERVSAIPLGVSEFWFGARNRRKDVRKAFGIDQDKIVMVTVSRLTRRKGHHLTWPRWNACRETCASASRGW